MKMFFQKWFPPMLAMVMALWFLGQIQPPPELGFAFNDFGQLPVVFNGRLKPIDSLARNSLLQIREKQTRISSPGKSGINHRRLFPPRNGWRMS